MYDARVEVHHVHVIRFDDGGVVSAGGERLRIIERLLTALMNLTTKGFVTMNQQVKQIVDAVAAQKGEIASLKAFVAGLEQAIKDALSGVTLPPEVQSDLDGVFQGLNSNTQEIHDAIDNDPNTPPQTQPGDGTQPQPGQPGDVSQPTTTGDVTPKQP